MSKYQRDILPLAALLLVGSGAFLNLMAIPAFEDEGSQLRWVWRLIESADWLQPLADGKPLEAWPMAPLVRLGIQPLLMIRAVHVLVGIIGAMLTYGLALRLTDRTTSLVSGMLFAICPFVVYLQRFALSDMLLCTGGAWALLSVLKLMEAPDVTHALESAFALTLAAVCKLPVGFIFIASIPLALVLMPSSQRRALLRPPELYKVLTAIAPATALASAIAFIAIFRMRQGHPPGFGLQDLVGVGMGGYADIASTIGIPRPTLIDELAVQLTWPVVIVTVIGLTASAMAGDWRERWLLLAGLIPMLAIGLFARFWYSRYLLFTLPPLIVCATVGWQRLSLNFGRFRTGARVGILALCAGLLGQQSVALIRNPLAARWSALDRFQYFQGWGSGYGYPEAARFILASAEAPRMIYSLDGHSAYQLRNYLPAQWSSRVATADYGHDGMRLSDSTARLENLLRDAPVWIVIADQLLREYLDADFGREGVRHLNLRRVTTFDRPGSRSQLAIYEVTVNPGLTADPNPRPAP